VDSTLKRKYIIRILIMLCVVLLLLQVPSIGIMEGYFMTDSNFNVWGDKVQSTYADRGYDTILAVDR